MNVGGIGAFAGGLAGGYQKERGEQREDKLADAVIDYRGAESQLAGERANTLAANRQGANAAAAAILREQGMHALAATFDNGPADAAGWATLQKQKALQTAPAPTLTQPGTPDGSYGI